MCKKKNRFCHFVVSRLIYEILPHKYDIKSGIFPKYLTKIKKKINNTFQHKFSILHGSIVDSLLRHIVGRHHISGLSDTINVRCLKAWYNCRASKTFTKHNFWMLFNIRLTHFIYALKTSNVNLQDWKYTSFKVFIPLSRNMRRHKANLMAGVVENIGFKFIFQI